MILNKRQKYLQVAMNRSLNEAINLAYRLPKNERILVEAGTPLIKQYGMEAVRRLANIWPYVVADLKTMDRGMTEVMMAREAGASAAVALGEAPVETVVSFIENCKKVGIDSMVDMMNVDQPLKTLRKLKKMPDVVILHRGVDEEEFNHDKPVPYIQINKIRSAYDVMISIAGGDTVREVQRAVFNDANIVVVWKDLNLVEEFLKEIK
jgi:bifunctional enzyme Fae/Hps